MGLFAEYEITCEGLPFVDVAAAVPEATLELQFHPSGDWYTAFVVRVVDGDREAIERAFESLPFVASYAPVRQADDAPCYRVEPAVGMEARLGGYVDDVSELQALTTADVDLECIRVTGTGWIQRGWFADRETLEAFRTFWARNGEFTLRRLTPAGGSDDAGTGLTDPQRAALVTAAEMGYFEIPRTASLADVAAELDITASSLSERLRRAHSHLVETTVAPSTRS